MKTRKIVALLLCAVLLVGASVMGTLAYLTAESNEVTNRFKTVGKVEFQNPDPENNIAGPLDEAKVDSEGNPLDAQGNKVNDVKDAFRVTENEYKLLPNHTYTKDPIVHISEDSEECWVFVKVENGLNNEHEVVYIDAEGKETKKTVSGIEAASEANGYQNIEAQMKANDWAPVDEDNGIWAYKETVSNAKKNLDRPVFEELKIDGSVDAATLEQYSEHKDKDGNTVAGETIVISAYAVQAEGFETAAAAWTGAKEALGFKAANNGTQTEGDQTENNQPEGDQTVTD